MKDRSFKLFASVAVVLVTLGAVSVAGAQPPGGARWGARAPVPFATLDRNGDGWVTESEFATHRAERMAARASQGRLMRNAAQAPAFSDFDRDRDGRLSADEVRRAQAARFASRGPGYGPGPGWGRWTHRPCWR